MDLIRASLLADNQKYYVTIKRLRKISADYENTNMLGVKIMEINATQPAFSVSSKQRASQVTTTNVEVSANPKDSQNLAGLPRLQKLDVDEFLNNYRNELSEAGNPADVIEGLISHQRRMFTEPDYFKQWNASTNDEQQTMIHGNQIAEPYSPAYLNRQQSMFHFTT